MPGSNRRMLWLLPLMVVGAVFLGACAGPLPTDLPPGLEVELVSDSSGLLARVEFTGTVEAMAPETWTVSGQTVGITPDTEINGTIAVGDLVKVEGEVGADGVFLAREIMPVLGGGGQPAPEKETFEFFGTIEVMGPDSWTVSGQTVAVTAATEIKGTFVLGDEVKVHALIEADGSFTAVEIGPASAPDMDDFEEGEIEFRALVEEIGAESWLIGGRAVALAAETLIDEGIVVGNLVEVHAFLSADGTLTASKIELEDEEHDEDDFGSPGMEFELRGLVEAIGADSWTVSGQVFLVTSATEIDEGIIVGSMVKVEGFVGQDGTYTAREIKADFEDDGEDHDDGIPGSKFGTSGTVESIGETSWTISGQVFLITPDTEIDEGIVVGSFVKVEAFVAADGSFTAHEIELEDEDESFEDEDEDDGDDFGGGSESDSDHDDDEDEQDNSGHDSEDDD